MNVSLYYKLRYDSVLTMEPYIRNDILIGVFEGIYIKPCMLYKAQTLTILFTQICMSRRNEQRDRSKSDSEIETLYGPTYQFSDWR